MVVVLAARDLMGQGDPLDAAVATGLLGMVRTFGIEGAKPGWRVNAVAGRRGRRRRGRRDGGDARRRPST